MGPGPVEQAAGLFLQESGRCAKPQDSGVDGRPDWALRSGPGTPSYLSEVPQQRGSSSPVSILLADVSELRGERFGHVLDRPPADTVEERTEAVAPAQPRSVPETGGGRRTVTCNVLCCALTNSCVAGWRIQC